MKNLKRAAIVLTAAAVSASMGVSAFAAIEVQNGSENKAVTGSYAAGDESATVYKVDVAWGDMTFTYEAADDGTWNPETHTFSGGTDAGWQSDSSDITITNHSNAALKAVLAFDAEANFDKITASFTNVDANNALSLDSAAAGDSLGNVNNAPTKSTTMSLDGTPEAFSDSQKIGTVTVTIQDAE